MNITNSELCALAERLGYDPNQVKEILLLPRHVEVTTYRVNEHGESHVCDCGNIATQTDTIMVDP